MNWNWFCFFSPRPTPPPTPHPPFCSECLRQWAPALSERRDVPQQRALPLPSRLHGHPVWEAAVRGGGQLRLRLRPRGAPARLPRAAAADRAAGHRQPPAGLGEPRATSPPWARRGKGDKGGGQGDLQAFATNNIGNTHSDTPTPTPCTKTKKAWLN